MAVQTKAETIKGALARYAKPGTKAPAVTKLPAEPPKSTNDGASPMGAYDESKYPVEIRLTDKQVPWLNQAKAGDETVLLVKVKVDRVISEVPDKGEAGTRATLCILEVAKL